MKNKKTGFIFKLAVVATTFTLNLSAEQIAQVSIDEVRLSPNYTRPVTPVNRDPSHFPTYSIPDHGDTYTILDHEESMEIMNAYPRNAQGIEVMQDVEDMVNAPRGFIDRYLETRNFPAQDFFETRWGKRPYYDTILPALDRPDGLPETQQIHSIEFEDASLSQVLRELARQMDISYIAPNDLGDSGVTVRFRDMSPTDAFRALVRTNGKEVYNTFGAFSLRDPQPPVPILRRYKLNFNYEDTAIATSSGSSSNVSTGGGAGTTSGTSSIDVDLEPDYSGFIENVQTLAAIDFGREPVLGAQGQAAQPTVIYQDTDRILTVNALPQGHEAILAYLETINKPQENIELEVFIAETSLNPRSELGIDWSFVGGNGYTISGSGMFAQAVSGFALIPGAPGPGEPAFGKLAMADISATIRMLEQDTGSKTYAHPRVLTTNNRPVLLESVIEVPYELSSTTTSTDVNPNAVQNNSTAFKRVGVEIGLRPMLQDQGVVRMKTSITISSVIGEAPDGQPIISTRSYGGDMSVMNGEYIIIGGLGQSSFTQTERGVPYLSALPFIGNFFKSKSAEKSTQHMLIFIRPLVKNNFYRGLEMNAMGKTAGFSEFREGEINKNVRQITRYSRNAIDPFEKANLSNTIVSLEERLGILEQTRDMVIVERDRRLDRTVEKKATLQREIEDLESKIKEDWDDPHALREVITIKVEKDDEIRKLERELRDIEDTYNEALTPIEKEIGEARLEKEISERELKRLEELDRLFVPQFDEDNELRLRSRSGSRVNVDLGSQVGDNITNQTIILEEREPESPDVVAPTIRREVIEVDVVEDIVDVDIVDVPVIDRTRESAREIDVIRSVDNDTVIIRPRSEAVVGEAKIKESQKDDVEVKEETNKEEESVEGVVVESVEEEGTPSSSTDLLDLDALLRELEGGDL